MLSIIGALVLYWVLHIFSGTICKSRKAGWHAAIPVLQDMIFLEIIKKKERNMGTDNSSTFFSTPSWLADLLILTEDLCRAFTGNIIRFLYLPFCLPENVQYAGPAAVLISRIKSKNRLKRMGRCHLLHW